jgi:hypothetical protein
MLVAAILLVAMVAVSLYQRHQRTGRWCAEYFDALRRQQNPDLARLTATIIEGYSIDAGECER